MTSEFHHGDSLQILPTLEPDWFTACVCDPPYHLTAGSQKGGFMGKTWDGGNIAFRPELWAEVLRVLRPGAMLLAFGGTRTFHRLTCAIEDAGFEIRDCLMWLYGSGFPKSHNISKALDKAAGAKRKVVGSKIGLPGYSLAKTSNPGGVAMSGNVDNSMRNAEVECAITAPATGMAQNWDGYGTALKPAWEPIILAMKPLDGTFANNVHQHGVAGLNIGQCRIETDDNLNGGAYTEQGGRQDLPGASRTTSEAGMLAAGKTADSPYVQPTGRWPANVILDEAAGELVDEQSGERPGCKSRSTAKPKSKFRPGQGEYMPQGPIYADTGGASRFYYCAKANKKDRTCEGQIENNHATVKPRSLMEYLCRLVTPPGGGVILDPFMGSGSTGLGAIATGNQFVGIELEQESFETAQQRIRTVQ